MESRIKNKNKLKNHDLCFMLLNSSQKGFTLLEALIYIGLISIVIGGALITTYQLMSSQSNLSKKVYAHDEAAFLNRKIEWALSEISAINYPAPNATGNYISLNKSNFGQNPVIIDLAGDQMRIKKGSGDFVPLNSDWVQVSSLSFQFNRIVGQSIGNMITASFYIDGEYFETKRLISR